MTFPMPVLVDVLSARYTSTGAVDYELVVTNHCGNIEPETIPYTRDVNEEWLPDGRLYDFGLEIDSWMLSHPDFEIAEYVAPFPLPEPTPDEKLNSLLGAFGLTKDALRDLLK